MLKILMPMIIFPIHPKARVRTIRLETNKNPVYSERAELAKIGKGRCATCQGVKPLSAFEVNPRAVSGHARTCKVCQKQ